MKKIEWWDAGMVMCLGQGADLHMTQLMHCYSLSLAPVNPDWFYLPFWFYLSDAGSPGWSRTKSKRAVNGGVNVSNSKGQ